MKCNSMILAISCLIGVQVIIPEVEAAGRGIHCSFHWEENPALNIRGGDVVKTGRVRKKLFDKLIVAGRVDARVAVKGGGTKCQYIHPASSYFYSYFDHDYYGFRINNKGRVPACDEIKMTVFCHTDIEDDL